MSEITLKIDGSLHRDAGRTAVYQELHVREIREESREVDFIASDESIDSYDSIIKQNWDLGRWKDNAPILWAHDRSLIPIGQATSTKVLANPKRLAITVKFAGADVTPLAEQVYQGVLQKFIRAGSVGFYPSKVTFEKHDGREIMVLDENELLEFSLLPIGSNKGALAQLRTRALADAKPTGPLASRTAFVPPPQDVAAVTPQEPPAERGEQQGHAMTEAEIAALKTTVEKREAEVRAKDADLEVARAAVESERAAKAILERELDKARADAKEATDRAVKAEASIVERDVGALVGVKITPAEKDEMLELAKKDRSLFDRIVAKRSNLGGGPGLVGGPSVLPKDEGSQTRAPAGTTNHDQLFADFQKSLGN